MPLDDTARAKLRHWRAAAPAGPANYSTFDFDTMAPDPGHRGHPGRLRRPVPGAAGQRRRRPADLLVQRQRPAPPKKVRRWNCCSFPLLRPSPACARSARNAPPPAFPGLSQDGGGTKRSAERIDVQGTDCARHARVGLHFGGAGDSAARAEFHLLGTDT